jgi:hypothetical protein
MKHAPARSACLFLNTYTPLVRSEAGRQASKQCKLPPFIDGSIRREPDLQHKWPAITCLCRADKFAPRLVVGDHVVYMTCTGNWHKLGEPKPPRHRRLTAVLRVDAPCESHEEAAKWYTDRKLGLPSNLMVENNPPNPLEKSHRLTRFRCAMSDGKLHDRWDAAYKRRAKRFKQVVICKPVYCSLGWDAPTVYDRDLIGVFGKLPGTQNPGALPFKHLEELALRLKLKRRGGNW